ncbi:hypothetical protein ACFLZB_03980 [Nanoarchaeota archaeon]
MGLYHTKEEEKTMLFNKPIEEAYETPKLEKKDDLEVKVNDELPEFLRAPLDGAMLGRKK